METQDDKKAMGFVITKNTKHVSDSGKAVFRKVIVPDNFKQEFRLLDDDDLVYFYGFQSTKYDEFSPLDNYGVDYGCTTLQYKHDITGDWCWL